MKEGSINYRMQSLSRLVFLNFCAQQPFNHLITCWTFRGAKGEKVKRKSRSLIDGQVLDHKKSQMETRGGDSYIQMHQSEARTREWGTNQGCRDNTSVLTYGMSCDVSVCGDRAESHRRSV